MLHRKVHGLTQRELAQGCITLSCSPSTHSTCTPCNCDKQRCQKCPACRIRSGASQDLEQDLALIREALKRA